MMIIREMKQCQGFSAHIQPLAVFIIILFYGIEDSAEFRKRHMFSFGKLDLLVEISRN